MSKFHFVMKTGDVTNQQPHSEDGIRYLHQAPDYSVILLTRSFRNTPVTERRKREEFVDGGGTARPRRLVA